MDNNITRIIQGMAEDILEIMKAILDENDLQNSNLKRDLYTTTTETDNGYDLNLFANFYIYWVDQGRGPSKIPPMTRWVDPVGDITGWCKRKGIPSDNKTVWRIIQKIHKYGYEGKFFLEGFWRDAEEKTYNNLDILFEEIIKELTEWFNK